MDKELIKVKELADEISKHWREVNDATQIANRNGDYSQAIKLAKQAILKNKAEFKYIQELINIYDKRGNKRQVMLFREHLKTNKNFEGGIIELITAFERVQKYYEPAG